MNSTANAFWLGLERSNGFIDYFTTGMDGDDWLRQPPGMPNSAIWILGHLALSRASFLEQLTGAQAYEDGWKELFGLGVAPQDPSSYPDVETCRSVLDARLDDLRSYLETVREEDFDAPPSNPSRVLKTKADVLVFLTHHEAHHTGALSLLRRMLGKDRLI
ncbi:DinB family protein [Candidatus Bipolaricaulota bacterium]